VLCDADGNLFPSEEPAFDTSVEVTLPVAQRYGIGVLTWSPLAQGLLTGRTRKG
jgi:aryl-alcohol dehydrogenase-like predicted oxidoreductase